MSKNLLIKSKSPNSLLLVEAADSTPQSRKYIFSGVFTACSTPDHIIINRNRRSYPETEMLKHIHYLRENIKNNGFILGELDHPVDRFDTQMKEASHKITDIWYDQASHNVMGKLEVLDTPNGEIAKKLIDAGYPLFVSSRAAGDVDPKTHEVHIEQIFTYDIVCTPGFAEARLERVDESLGVHAMNYLNESISTQKAEKTATKKYGVLLEGVSVCEMECEAPISASAKEALSREVSVDEVCNPILEEEITEEDKVVLPQPELNPTLIESDEEENKEEKEENKDEEPKTVLTDEEKAEKRALILNVEAIEVGEDEQTEEEEEDKRDQILDIEIFSDEDEEKEESEDKKDEKKSEDKKDSENKEKAEKTDECGDNPTEMKTKEIKTYLLNDAEKAEDIKNKTNDDMDKFKQLLSKANTKKEVKESICKNYPFAVSLSDENFAKFAALNPNQKNKCQKFIIEHAIFDIKQINELWATPLIEEKRQLKNWLRLASDEDKRLFTEATQEEQDAIEESAKYVVIQSAEDADLFWERTGLRQRAAQKYINEMNQNRYNIATKEDAENVEVNEELNEAANQLGYSMNYFKMLEDGYRN